jgi:hypothetical protein
LANNISGAAGYLGGWRTLMSTDFHFNFVRAQRLKPQRDVYRQISAASVGIDIRTASTANTCMSITKRTATIGRHGVGRIQLAGLPVGEISNGNWSDAIRGSVSDVFDDLLGPLTTTTTSTQFTPVVWDSKNIGATPHAIIEVDTQATVRTMHRRTVGLGE